MNFKEALTKLKNSDTFEDKGYLSYGFIMLEPQIKKEWQIGYYHPNIDKITTYTVADKIIKNPESEIFKKNPKVLKLDLEAVNINYKQAEKTADELQGKKYPSHKPFKKILILQRLSLGQVWNVTYVSKSFKTLNIKVDSLTGKAVSHELIDLFRFT
jgi:hypothetical protein